MEGQADNDTLQDAGGNAGSEPPFSPSTDPAVPPANVGDAMHRGWFKVWRKWADHEVARDANAWLVLTHMLCETRRTPRENRRYGYVLERGQTDLTRGQLEERTGLSSKQIRAALERLERYGTIKRGHQKGRSPAVTTIVNYDLYNPDTTNGGHQEGQLGAGKGPVEGQQRATPLEVKTVENGENTTTTLTPPATPEPSKIKRRSWAGDWEPTIAKMFMGETTVADRCKLLNGWAGIAGKPATENLIRNLEARNFRFKDIHHAHAYGTSALSASVKPEAQPKVTGKYQRGYDAYGD